MTDVRCANWVSKFSDYKILPGNRNAGVMDRRLESGQSKKTEFE